MRRPALGLLVTLGLTSTGCYVTSQAWHQNNLFNSRRPVSEVLADPKTDAKARKALEQTREILAFAQTEGLRAEGAYAYYIETDRPAVSYLVQAARADKLEAVTWWFPVIGRVPYMGFFDERERDEKAAELRADGYDVYVSGVGAFSSLGWFEDPLFTSMLRRGEADLAHLLFHELTHRTLWVSGSTEFNENLAEYVAAIVTRDYLTAKHMTAALRVYDDKRADRRRFKAWLQGLRAELEALYDKPPASRQALLAAKAAVFARRTAQPQKPVFKAADYVGDPADWNNAAVLGATLYSPDVTRFAAAAKCVGGGVSAFLAALDAAADELDDGFAALDSLCAHGGSGVD
jgi:predicted aminopeptidase